MTAIQAVIFDRDGVLTQFDMPAAIAYLQPLLGVPPQELAGQWLAWGKEHGFPKTMAEEQSFWRGFWERVSAYLSLDAQATEALQAFDYTCVVRPYPDARPALETARRHGLKTAVLSNFTLASIDASLAVSGLADVVDIAASSTIVGAAKPEPEAYLYITRRLQVSPEACLLFDDKLPCVQGARALNMQAYLVDRQRSQHALAEGVVCDLSALSTILRMTQ